MNLTLNGWGKKKLSGPAIQQEELKRHIEKIDIREGKSMNAPKVFISSTIYDFSDLRSALKYWLNELGFDAQLSECNDFQKDVTINSYEACLHSVSECDYFVLLIGTRKGGIYPGESISITQKEYRAAYELAKSGKIKKLIVFIRQSVWDVKEDRKALHNLLKDLTILEKEKSIDVFKIEHYNSNILKDAEHIVGFIDEVTRKADAQNGKMPCMNWVHTFTSFEDIISTLKAELKINANLSVQVAEQNIKMALVHNLQNTTYRTEGGKITAFYLPFSEIREKIKCFRDVHENIAPTALICLTKEEVHNISNFLLFFRNGIDDINSYEFDNAIANGIFLKYDRKTEKFIYNGFCSALYQMSREIHRLKRFVHDFSYDVQDKMLNSVRNYHKIPRDEFEFEFMDIAMLSSIYERLMNIQNLTSYMIQYIASHDDEIPFPKLMDGLVYSGRPSEDELLRIFEG